MREQWRDVIRFVGLYQASNLGRIKSLDRVVRNRRGGTRKLKGQILRPGPTGSYLSVSLSRDGIKTTIMVYRIVAEAWLGPCPDGMEVCHGPNGKLDNSVSNLRYDTRTNNNLDKRRDSTHGGKRVRRSDGSKFIHLRAAAKESGCHRSSISKVCKGKRKTAGGYGWVYV